MLDAADARSEAESGDSRTEYVAPIDDIMLALDVAGLDGLLSCEGFRDVDRGSIRLALGEFGRIAADVITPTDRVGDRVGANLDTTTASVRTPDEFHKAYEHYVDGGWGALPFPSVFGGGGLPGVVGLAIQEMFASANMALSLNPVLTQGAIESLLQWGSDEQRSLYLPRLIAGEWTGTMNLTEPDAGSDLGEIRSFGSLGPDGTWRVTGTKVFITWGEHDLAENIIHLVLARTPDAPPGTKGLSLFLVPKFVVGDAGGAGSRNSVKCLRLEEKLGIHGSPTCVMEFDQARGELVGPLHGGMRAMFTMMNAARLSIGIEGPAIGERAFQAAWRYAADRRQGRAEGVAPPVQSPIIDHPDVRRMLLTMTSTTQAARLLLYTARAFADQAQHAPVDGDRRRAQQFADLLTPAAKAWSTEVGVAAASLGVQVLGGSGYMEEFGMAQRLRDVRIAPIYEGTNGIQAIDLVTRKLPRDDGRWVHEILATIASSLAKDRSPNSGDDAAREALSTALATLTASTEWMLSRLASQPSDAVAGASAYTELFALTVAGWLMMRRADVAASQGFPDLTRVVGECHFFANEILSRAVGLAKPIVAGAKALATPIGSSMH